MTVITHAAKEELTSGLDHIRQSPQESGVLEMIVLRPSEDARESLEQGQLDPRTGACRRQLEHPWQHPQHRRFRPIRTRNSPS